MAVSESSVLCLSAYLWALLIAPCPDCTQFQAYHLDDILCLTHAKAAKARSMVSGKVQVLEVSYETPYIRDTSPLVSFVLTHISADMVWSRGHHHSNLRCLSALARSRIWSAGFESTC